MLHALADFISAWLRVPIFVTFCIGNNRIESHASFLLATRFPVSGGGVSMRFTDLARGDRGWSQGADG